MDQQGELTPRRDIVITMVISVLVAGAIFTAPGSTFPTLHTILNTGIALVTLVVSLLFWDLGWRTNLAFVRWMAILFAVAALLELVHVIVALEPATASSTVNDLLRTIRSGTWAPPAYLLPCGLLFLLWFHPGERASQTAFALGTLAVAAALFAVFQVLPRYAEPGFLGIVRPSLLPVPLLWIPVAMAAWRRRSADPIAHVLAWYALGTGLSHVLMLYSDLAISRFAMTAHFGVFAFGLYLLLGVIQMGTADTARRMRAERALKLSNEALEARVAERTAELERANAQLRRAYDDLRLSQNAVLQQERLRALGQMASGIAHDINNAISPVSLYVDTLLTRETGFSERARKQLEVIQRAVDDVAHTVSRMGEFARQRPGQSQLQAMDVNAVLSDVLELTRARWSDMAQRRGAVIEARIEPAPGAPVVEAIENEIREALVNLVLNATDAMPDGGTLTLRAGQVAGPAAGESRMFIEVADTGAGMDEATRRRCLEPFFTTKGDRGSGLGLAMVYGIAQRHGLDIDIQSAPGAGTRIRLTFPPTSPDTRAAGSQRIRKPPGRTRILLIDDDPLLLEALRETLEAEGHEVQTANGGRAGIDLFLDALDAGQPFPVVITDLGMPHVDGRAVAAAIRSAAPDTAIVMLTGWGQRLVASGEVPPGVSVVMSKPPRLAEIRRWLAETAAARPG